MNQKFNSPKSEKELRDLLDNLFSETKKAISNGKLPIFKGLLEIASSEATILTAIHKIKANKGRNTPGVDGMKMDTDLLQQDYKKVIETVKKQFIYYNPKPLRRIHILKSNGKDKRPLGLPSLIDKVVQECIRLTIEPILEAQFFEHSYGFRPMRDAHMAFQRLTDIAKKTKSYWVVEGDIKSFFDTVNHTVLLKKLWNLGVRDRRILMIIKAMLEAGVMKEKPISEEGTPQGGIISPLLANVYLHSFDEWVTREWEQKRTKHHYSYNNRIRALKTNSNLKPAYLIRYADDWVLVTDSKINAIKWKYKIEKYLRDTLKLDLSKEKTLITDIRKRYVTFLGLDFKLVRNGKAKMGYVIKSKPNEDKLKNKIKETQRELRKLRKCTSKEYAIHHANLINSKIRGIIGYYEIATFVNISLKKYRDKLDVLAVKIAKRRWGGDWIPAHKTNNLLSVHEKYTKQIAGIPYNDMIIGITSFAFCKWKIGPLKNQKETPYTIEGRQLYAIRASKKPLKERADEILNLHQSEMMGAQVVIPIYNFEYYLNRAYTFNRDRGKCKVCSQEVLPENLHIHHISPKLSLTEVNKVKNLATVHKHCHNAIHSKGDYSQLGAKPWSKIKRFREKLGI